MNHVHTLCVSNRLEIEANKTNEVPALTDPKIYEMSLVQASQGQQKRALGAERTAQAKARRREAIWHHWSTNH